MVKLQKLQHIFRKYRKVYDGSATMVDDLFEQILYDDEDEETMKTLIFRGSPVLSAHERSRRKESFLHKICCRDKSVIAQLLIDFGVNVDKQDVNGNTALHAATGLIDNYNRSINLNMIRVLLKNGANQYIRNKDGLTPMQLILLSGNLEIAEEFLKEEDKLPNVTEVDRTKRSRHLVECLLREGKHCNIFNTKYSVLLHFLLYVQDEETFEYVVNNTKLNLDAVYSEHSLLTFVTRRGTIRMITALFNVGVDLNKQCPYSGKTPLIVAIEFTRIEMVNFLLDCGVSVSKEQKCRNENNSPLHYAVCRQNVEIVEKLLKMGADVNALTYRRSPLLLACGMSEWSSKWPKPDLRRTLRGDLRSMVLLIERYNINHFELSVKIVEVLLDHGADIEARNASNRTALDQACRFGRLDIVKLLLSRGAKINQGAVSTLHHAVRGENVEIVKLILQHGADVNYRCAPEKMLWYRDDYEVPPPRTPLECALHFIEDDSTCKNIIEVLMEYGVNVNVSEPLLKETPLHLACLSSHDDDFILEQLISRPETIQLLLRHNANVNALDSEGLIPLNYALYNHTFYNDINEDCFKPDLVSLIAFIAIMIENKECVIEENLKLLKHEALCPIYQECIDELNLTKKNICESRNFSFYNILSKDIRSLGSTLKNEDLLQVLNSGEYKKNFPIYAEYLEDRIREATICQSVVDLAMVLFQKHVNKNFSVELRLNILKFLNMCDLKNFAKACFVDVAKI